MLRECRTLLVVYRGSNSTKFGDLVIRTLRVLGITIRNNLRGLGKFLDAPKPSGRVSNPLL